MTDATHPNEAQSRIDRLRASRAENGNQTAAAPRRRPARGAKIAAAGLGTAAMLGLVGAMGYAARSTTTDTQPVVVPGPQIVVVVHQKPATSSPSNAAVLPASPTTAPATAPIALTAQPVVRQAPATQTPIAKTHGSR